MIRRAHPKRTRPTPFDALGRLPEPARRVAEAMIAPLRASGFDELSSCRVALGLAAHWVCERAPYHRGAIVFDILSVAAEEPVAEAKQKAPRRSETSADERPARGGNGKPARRLER